MALGLSSFFAVAHAVQFVPDSSNRTEQNFDMNWKFKSGTVSGTPQAVSYDDSQWPTVSVPCPLKMVSSHLDGSTDCNSQLTYDRTTGWFRKHFTLQGQGGKKVFVAFQTVMQVATVYVNGTTVGTHEISGYDSFHFDITDYVNFAGDNVIAVFVDNNIDGNTPPDFNYNGACPGFPSGIDFILFGGINGDVSLVCTDNLRIGFQWEAKNSGIVVTTPSASAGSATVKVVTTLRNENSAAKSATVTATVVDAGNQVVTTVTSAAQNIAAAGSAVFALTSPAISNPHLWSIDDPYLYKVYVSVKTGATVADEKCQKFGIRWYDFNTSTGFHLNGQSVKLIGINRHSAWPFVGGAIPNTVHRREAQQIKSYGFNVIRLAHYPHDPDFLDALDSLGILATEEGPTWALGNAPYVKTDNATWYANLVTALRRMIRRDINHPSIVIWQGNINHGGCDAGLNAAAQEEDSTRYIGTCVSDPLGVDVVHCFSDTNPWSEPTITQGGAFCQEHTGHTFPTARFFTSDHPNELRMFQHARRHWEEVGASRAAPGNAGLAAWAGYDYNSFWNSGMSGGDRNMVFHGLFDLFRIPKFAAFWYKSELTSAPMVFIANYWTANSPHDTVGVFSNCSQVELFLNGVSLGKQSPSKGNQYMNALNHPPFFFTNATWASGTLVALGYNGTAVVAGDTVRTPGAAAKLKVETDTDTLLADGSDFARIIVSVCDANGTVVPTSSDSVSMTSTGVGAIISENPITADAGQIIFLARGGATAGAMTVTAHCGSLTTASKTIVVTGASTGISNMFSQNQGIAQKGIKAIPAPFKVVGGIIPVPAGLSTSNCFVEVYDLRGRLVCKKQIKGIKEIDLDKSGQADGLHIVRMSR